MNYIWVLNLFLKYFLLLKFWASSFCRRTLYIRAWNSNTLRLYVSPCVHVCACVCVFVDHMRSYLSRIRLPSRASMVMQNCRNYIFWQHKQFQLWGLWTWTSSHIHPPQNENLSPAWVIWYSINPAVSSETHECHQPPVFNQVPSSSHNIRPPFPPRPANYDMTKSVRNDQKEPQIARTVRQLGLAPSGGSRPATACHNVVAQKRRNGWLPPNSASSSPSDLSSQLCAVCYIGHGVRWVASFLSNKSANHWPSMTFLAGVPDGNCTKYKHLIIHSWFWVY